MENYFKRVSVQNTIDTVDIVDKLMDKRYPLGHVDISLAGQEIIKLRKKISELNEKLDSIRNLLDNNK
jgi:hypothetical protein